ncbi:uncharacterized protein LOC111113283 [Crassostrea virginica]|uniref:Uncharacterized protein LOC111113283 n=1 Tax=Crassostrea virginica TaxID=6565 RepID=A0A8B8BW76_CRAVI|nr:uncharacterized protein LOC111113283 [Crassostrea virginica]
MKYTILFVAISLVYSQLHHHDIALLVDGTFKFVDRNPTDGTLQYDELMGAFHYLDADGSGTVSFEEYIKHHHDNTLQHEIFNNFDTNHDGLLQTSEYVDAPFMAMDHNGDHVVSRTDYDHYYTNMIHHIIQNQHGHTG